MRTITFREAINEALDEEMARDNKVFMLGEDVGFYGSVWQVAKGLYDKYGKERLRDTPISESAIVGTALGAAACGFRPIAEIMFSDFMTCAMDQIVNQTAKMRYMFGGQVRIPMVIRSAIGAGLSAAAQHSQSFEAYFMHTPGLKIVVPSTPKDAKGLLKSAIREDNPVIFFEHKLLQNKKGEVPEGEYTIPLGEAEIKRIGKDITIVTYLNCVPKSIKAAEKLEEEGISVEIVDLRTIVPMDMKTIINSISKTGRLLVVIEEVKTCGVAAEIMAIALESGFKSPIVRVCSKDTPVPFNPILENYVIPQVEDIIESARIIIEEQ